MKKFIFFLLIICAFFFTGCRGSYEKYDETDFIVGQGEFEADIKYLEINWHTGDINIIYEDVEVIKLLETSKYVIDSNLSLRYKLTNSVLVVRYAQSGLLLPAAHMEKDLTIVLPREYELDNIYIKNITGDISSNVYSDNMYIETVTSDVNIDTEHEESSFEIKNVTGDVDIKCFDINKLNVECVTGDVDVFCRVVKGGVYAEITTGEFELESAFFMGEGRVDITTGEIDIINNNFTDILIKYSVVTGDVTILNQKHSRGSGEVKIGQGSRTLDLSIVTGDIDVIDTQLGE